MKPDQAALDQLQQIIGNTPTSVIGDANHAGKVANAVRDGYLAAMKII
jgi:hypothetical protein